MSLSFSALTDKNGKNKNKNKNPTQLKRPLSIKSVWNISMCNAQHTADYPTWASFPDCSLAFSYIGGWAVAYCWGYKVQTELICVNSKRCSESFELPNSHGPHPACPVWDYWHSFSAVDEECPYRDRGRAWGLRLRDRRRESAVPNIPHLSQSTLSPGEGCPESVFTRAWNLHGLTGKVSDLVRLRCCWKAGHKQPRR